jgi:hypothetical protein
MGRGVAQRPFRPVLREVVMDDSAPAGEVLEWEFRDLVVPLNLSPLDVAENPTGFDTVVQEHLARVQRAGWLPDEPVDFASLRAADRLTGGIGRDFGGLSDYLSATIRLKRQVRVVLP